MGLSVWGQAGAMSSAMVVDTQRPSVTVVGLQQATNGTHHFVRLTGTGFGSAVSDCPDDVPVTVDGTPCEALTVTQAISGLLQQVARSRYRTARERCSNRRPSHR